MRRTYTNHYQVEIEYPGGQRSGRDRQVKTGAAAQAGVSRAIRGLGYVFSGIWRYLTAARYQQHRVRKKWLTRRNVLVFKLAFAALALFFVFQQDFRISINLLKPAEGAIAPAQAPVEKMGVATPMAMKTKPVKEKSTVFSYGSARYSDLKHRRVERYIEQHRDLARREMQHFGIPASLKMGMAILESQAGEAAPTAAFNNHFGRHLKGVNFQSVASNWRAHSLYLQENYPQLGASGTHYLDWIRTLEQLDYGDRSGYAQDLLQIIKDYQLYRLDR